MENHCKEYHLKCLRQLCRICSGRSLTVKDKKNKRSEIMCSSNAADINILFGINVFHDIPGVHSDVMCFKCYSRIKNYMKKKSDSMLASARETVEKSKKVWDVYNPDVHCKDCNICSTFDTTASDTRGHSSELSCHHSICKLRPFSTNASRRRKSERQVFRKTSGPNNQIGMYDY